MTERYYDKIPIGHNPEDVGLVQRMVSEFKPHFSVELGTMHGGMTLAIHDAHKGSPIATYDNKRMYTAAIAGLIRDGFILFYCWDVLSFEVMSLVRYLQNRRSKKFFYCDNGNKVRELLMYAGYLQSGDMLGVHDWGTEVHTDPEKVEPKWRAINGDDNFNKLATLLADFELVGEGEQTRLWIKK